MKIESNGTRQLVCDSCKSVISSGGYYPEKRGSMSFHLKNDDGDDSEYHTCGENCSRALLNSRHEIKNKSIPAQASEKQVVFARNGMVTLDFSKVLKENKKG
jgi:hypothetical protein